MTYSSEWRQNENQKNPRLKNRVETSTQTTRRNRKVSLGREVQEFQSIDQGSTHGILLKRRPVKMVRKDGAEARKERIAKIATNIQASLFQSKELGYIPLKKTVATLELDTGLTSRENHGVSGTSCRSRPIRNRPGKRPD